MTDQNQELLLRLQRAEVVLDLVGNIFQDAMRLFSESNMLQLTGGHEQIASIAFAIYSKEYMHNSHIIKDKTEAIEILKGLILTDPKAPEGTIRLVERLYS